jgi:16S rRNA (cytosine967-C5)-methyltransferase
MNQESSVRAEAIRALIQFEESTTSMKTLLREMQTTSVDSVTVQSLALSVIRFRNTIDYLLTRAFGKRAFQHFNAEVKNTLRLILYESKWLGVVPKIDSIFSENADDLMMKLESIIQFDLDTAFRKMADVNRLSLRYSHPTFLVQTLLDNLSINETSSILKANNEPRSYYVRPNLLFQNSRSFLESLNDDIVLEQIPDFPSIFRVKEGIQTLVTSDLFTKGKILVQDLASIITVKSLNPLPGEKIWDACAAPGMKTQLIAEMLNGRGTIVATDVYKERVKIAHERAILLNAKDIEWKQADATNPQILDADKILIDAPCTSTGILQAYPSFKWRLNKDTLFALMTVQNKLLDGIITTYRNRPGTEIVYSTCSLLPHEGESQIDSVMKRHNIELLDPYPFGDNAYPKFECSEKARRLFPNRHQTSGFFIARFRIKQ